VVIALLVLALQCAPTVASAKLAQASALAADAKAQRASAEELRELVAEDERDLAQERANPAGVVDLARLHAIGEELVQHRQALALARQTAAAEEAQARRLLAEASAIIAACKVRP
jgi:Mg2+/Co2+ transporter CorB